jgi:small-conductance mechanosensitive channel
MRSRTFLAGLILSILLIAPLPSLAQAVSVTSPPSDLYFENRKIVTLRGSLGPITPAQRTAAAKERFDAIKLGLTVPAVDVSYLGESVAVLSVRGTPIVTILAADVDPVNGTTLAKSAELASHMTHEALAARREMRSGRFLLRASLTSLGATIVFVLFFILLRRIVRRIRVYIPDPGDARFSKFTLFGFKLGPYAVTGLERLVILFGLATHLLAAYVWVLFVLLQFPTTSPWGAALDNYLFDTLARLGAGALSALPGLGTVLIIFLLTRFFVRLSAAFFDAVEHRRIDVGWLQPETANATRRILTVVIWIFGISVAYPYIPGSDSPAFKGLSVFVGLMVSLGSAGLVNQVMSGLVVVYSRAFKPGDVIKVGEVEGLVTEVGVLSTKVITRKRLEITIPNAVLVGTTTTNFSSARGDTGLILHTSVTIGYDSPWRQVHALLLLAAERTASIRKEPRPFVLQTSLSDFYAEYQLNVYIDDPTGRAAILSELHAKIQDAFNEFGVQIMSPNFEAQPENKVWVPQQSWFEAPATPDKGKS